MFNALENWGSYLNIVECKGFWKTKSEKVKSIVVI